MMRRLSLLLLLSLGLSACGMLRDQIKTPTVSYQSVELQDLGLQAVTINFHLLLANPNGFSIPVQGTRYTLRLHGKEVLSGNVRPNIRIPARGAVELQLPMTINYETFLSGLGEIFRLQSVNYDLQGEMDLGLLKLPFQTQGELSLK